MLSLLLAVTMVTTESDLVRYAAEKGVKVATKTPAAVVSTEQVRGVKAWVDGESHPHQDRHHPRPHRHHSTSEPD
jgi:hypothetical protein